MVEHGACIASGPDMHMSVGVEEPRDMIVSMGQ
jgi:hypothetical protein